MHAQNSPNFTGSKIIIELEEYHINVAVMSLER